MTGTVTPYREAALAVIVRGPHGQEEEVEAIVDTGFTGFLTLPSTLIATLALVFHSRTIATLADGTSVLLPIYEATVLWDGQERDVLVLEAEGGCLLGMSLLYGSRLTIDVIDGGSVTVTLLP
jgi:clan AA aspartic protease